MVRRSSGRLAVDGMNLADVPDIAAAIMGGVRVEHLFPLAGKGHANAIVAIDVGGEVDDHQAARVLVEPLAQPGEHVAIGVVGNEPFEAGLVAVHLVQRRHRAIEPVEVADQRLDARVIFVFEQVPVERLVVIPFAALRDLGAHEQELLAGMAEHEAVIGTQVREALPFVAGHAAQDRALAVHDLVMRQRQDEIFREGIVQAEQDLAVMMLAMNRILADVVQRVVHPAHVPLVAEAEPAEFDRARDLRPRRGFFRRRGCLRKAGEQFGVEAAQERDRLDVLPSAILVRNPGAGRTAVVEIEHRCDGIDAQAVDRVALQPEQRVRHQEVRHFGAAVIVDQRAPVEVPALQRVGVLVERGAVEAAEPVRIVREVTGHPVEQHADAFAVAGVDQRGKIFRRAEPAGRCIEAGRLIAPGAVERVLADGEEFEMGEPHVAGIGRQLLGQLAVGEPFIVALAPPRAEMDLVDRHRRRQRIDAVRRRARPRQVRLVEHDGGRLRTHLARERHRIGFQRQLMAVRPDHVELVVIAPLGVRDEQFPIAAAAHPHRMAPRIPEIEIADDRHAPRIRRQHHEADAVDAVERHRVRAELVIEALMGAFAEQIEVEIGQDRRKAVGVLELDDAVAEFGA
ncbi:hypothetical protein ABIF39_008097 [Bradyrhizobium diazoefficiens]